MRSFNLAEAVHKLPGALEDMLVRGAYLEHSARELEKSRHEQAKRLENVRATQPPFLMLRPKETRVAFQVAVRDTSADLEVIDKALEVNKRLSDYLRASSEHLLERWLAEQCEEYQLGLAAGHFSGDWEQSLEKFRLQAQELVKALMNGRLLATSGYDHQKGVFTPATYEALSTAHALALKVEECIAATNAIAQEHDRLLGRTVFNDPMPRVVHEPYAAVVAQIASMPLMMALAEFNRVVAAVEDLLHRELATLLARVRESGVQHVARTQSYVRSAWNQLHAHAVAHSVEHEHVHAVVEQTEKAYREVLDALPVAVPA